MSSAPSQQPAPAGPPPPEKKAVRGPAITPQALSIAFGLILIIGIAVYWGVVVKGANERQAELASRKQSAETNIKTYKKKGARLAEARNIKYVLRDKLNNLGYLFMGNQDTVLPFWEDTMFPLIEGSRLGQRGVTIEVDEYEFQINPAMKPMDTLPRSIWFENSLEAFPIKYIGEKGGVPVEQPLTTLKSNFLEPYNITLSEMTGTYEDAMKFISRLQKISNDKIITVHCLKNDKGENVYNYRTLTQWTMVLTVYFMNPEGAASGDTPPMPPGANSC